MTAAMRGLMAGLVALGSPLPLSPAVSPDLNPQWHRPALPRAPSLVYSESDVLVGWLAEYLRRRYRVQACECEDGDYSRTS